MSGETESRAGWNPVWAELPPTRRRFWLWLVLLLFLLAPAARIPLEIFGLSPLMATLVVLGLTLLIMLPLGRAAWLEMRQGSGNEPPPPVEGRNVAGWAITTVIFWGMFAVAATLSGPLIPTLPVIATVMTAQRLYQWRNAPR